MLCTAYLTETQKNFIISLNFVDKIEPVRNFQIQKRRNHSFKSFIKDNSKSGSNKIRFIIYAVESFRYSSSSCSRN